MYPRFYLYKRIKDAKVMIDRNFTAPINLDLIAKQAYLSKYHFTRLFKESYGITPHQYIIQKRLERAKKELKSGMPVGEVCRVVGFESLSSFSHLFKNRVGLSPTRFQRNQE